MEPISVPSSEICCNIPDIFSLKRIDRGYSVSLAEMPTSGDLKSEEFFHPDPPPSRSSHPLPLPPKTPTLTHPLWPSSSFRIQEKPTGIVNFHLSHCCTQFKPFGNETFCSRYFHIIYSVNMNATLSCKYNTQRILIPGDLNGYNIELGNLLYWPPRKLGF